MHLLIYRGLFCSGAFDTISMVAKQSYSGV